MKAFISSILLIILITGCKENETPITIVKGKVVNSGTGIPIEGAKVVIQDGIGSTSGWIDTKTVGTGATKELITTNDGKFSFAFKGEAPFIWAVKDSYRFLNPLGAYEIYSLTAGKVYELKLTMDAYAGFSPILKGLNCLDTDSVYFDEGSIIPRAYTKTSHLLFGNGPIKRYGQEGLLARGDHYFPYWFKYQIKASWREKIDSVYIKSFTTYTDTIHY